MNAQITFNPNELSGGGNLLAAHNLNVNAARAAFMANGTLSIDEGKAIDAAVVKAGRQNLKLLGIFAKYGLIRPLGGLHILLDYWGKRGEFTAAETSMDGRTRSQSDRPDNRWSAVPIPIIHKEFEIGIRELEASRRNGTPLDTSGVEEATEVVVETIESMIVDGSTLKYAGNSITGLTNNSDRNTGSLTAAWTTTATRDILKDVRAMVQALFADRRYGPYALLIPDAYWTELQTDYTSYPSKTFFQRIKDIPGIVEIIPSSKLSAECVLLDLNPSSADISRALDLTVVPWQSGDGMVHKFKVMAALAPRIKADINGNSGVAHYTV
jgi:uncharacterized linocin/CFP29 family protein